MLIKFNDLYNYTTNNYFTGRERNNMFCDSETGDVSRDAAKANIAGRGITKHTAFPRAQQISDLL